MTNKQEHNTEARYFDNQVVIFDTTPASATNGSLVVGGGLSTKDTYVSGHVAVNNVRITPNLNDIVYELESILGNDITEWTSITDFYFDSSVATSFKALINVTVSSGSAKYAFWEINGVYKPSGWTITSSFTGDITGINFTIETENGVGIIKYKNSNTSGTTTIRYRASTNAPPGSNPIESTGLINNTSGPYIANRLLYANTVNTIANADVTYQNSILSVGGTSRLVTENTSTFTNFSNGGSITSMGDASIAKRLMVGEKVGIVNTAPNYTLDVTGDINFTGAFYKNGSLFTGDSVWETNQQYDVYYTRGNLGIGTTDPAYTLDVQGDAKIANGLTVGNANISQVNSVNITSGTVIATTISTSSLAATNVTLGSIKSTDATIEFLNSTHSTVSNLHSSQISSTNITTGTLIASNGITAGSSGITDISSSNIVAVNITTGTVNAVGMTAGNINFTGNLYQNGSLYVSSQWKSGDWSTISYNAGNVGIGTTNPTRTLDVVGTGSFTEGVTAGSIKTSNVDTTNSTITNIVSTNISTGFIILSTGMLATNISTGKLIASDGLTAGSSQISSVSGTNSTFTNATATNLVGTNTTMTNVSTGVLIASSGLTAGSSQISSVSGTNSTFTNATATNLVGTSLTMGSVQVTNINNTNISSGSARLTNLVATNSSLGTVNMSGGTVGGHLVPSANVTYDLGSANLRWNDIYLSGNTIHLGEKQLTLAGDTFTVEKLSVTNSSSATSASSGALVVSGGVGAANANITNMVSSNMTSGTANISNLSSTTVNSTLVAATTITGGNLSLSGNLNVAGTLTVVNITATNLMDTNLTAGVARVTTSLAAVGNSNTIGNIFTTGGNVGIGLSNPNSRLDVANSFSIRDTVTGTTLDFAAGLRGSTTFGGWTTIDPNSGTTGSNGVYIWDGLEIGGSATLGNTFLTNMTASTSRITTNLVAVGNSNTLGSIITTGGNVGIGTTAPTNTLDITGTARVTTSLTTGAVFSTNITSTNIVGTNVTTTSLVGTNVSTGVLIASTGLTSASAQITNLNATTETVGTSRITSNLLALGNSNTIGNIFTTGGNVGIGTGTPLSRLQVNGDISLSGSQSSPQYILANGLADDSSLIMRAGSTGALSQIRINSNWNGTSGTGGGLFFSTNNTERMRVNADGNVGIGTTAPSTQLHVNGNIQLPFGGRFTTIVNDNFIHLNNTVGHYSLSWNSDNANGSAAYLVGYAGVKIFTAGASRMFVDFNGNIGIGNTSPAFTLDVSGSGRFTGGVTVGNLEVTGLTDTLNLTATNVSTSNIVTISDQVIGNKSISSQGLHLQWNRSGGDGESWLINQQGAGPVGGMRFGTSNTSNVVTEWMRISSSGSLGIGTTAPGYQLTFTGDMGMDNARVINARNSTGGYEGFLWPRWSDNITYLNFGAGGFHIRNNASTTLMFMTSTGNVGVNVATPSNNLDVWGSSGFDQTASLRIYNNSSQFGRTQLQLVGRFESSNDAWSTNPRNAIMFQQQTAQAATINTKYIIQNFGEQLGILNGSATPLMVWNSTGNIGIGTTAPSNRLDIAAAARTGSHATGVPLYITGELGAASSGVEIRHSNGTQGLGFGFNSIYATGSNADQDICIIPRGSGRVGIATASPSFTLDVSGTARVSTAITTGGLEITGTGVVDTPNLTATNATINSLIMNGATRILNVGHTADTSNYSMEIFAPTSTGLLETSIRFHQEGRYWQQIRAFNAGFKFTQGDGSSLVSIQAGGITGSSLDISGTARITSGLTTGNLTVTTAASISSLSVSGTSLLDGGSRIVVQNNQDGGSGRGIYMWNSGDANWGIYMGQSGAGRSLGGGTACTGAGGFSQHAIRIRTTNSANQGLIYENSAESCLFSVRGSDGMTFVAGNLGVGNASPGYRLDVSGDINFTGTLRQNGVAFGGGLSANITASTLVASTAVTSGSLFLNGGFRSAFGFMVGTANSFSLMPKFEMYTSNDTANPLLYAAAYNGSIAGFGLGSYLDVFGSMKMSTTSTSWFIGKDPSFGIIRCTGSAGSTATQSLEFSINTSGVVSAGNVMVTNMTASNLRVTTLTNSTTVNSVVTNISATNLRVTNDFGFSANSGAWNFDLPKGLYMRYSTFGGQDAGYIQSVTRAGGAGGATYHPIILEASRFHFQTSEDTSRLFISPSGIGIGNTSPSFNLDVTGVARVSTGITTGGLEVTGLTDTLNLTATNSTLSNVMSTGLVCTGLATSTMTAGNIFVTTNATISNLQSSSIISSTMQATNAGSINSTFGGLSCPGVLSATTIIGSSMGLSNATIGSLRVSTSLSKASGTFDIEHPNNSTKRLVHSFIEGPRCDLIYRGKVNLINGTAVVNLDTDCVAEADCVMTEGTFESLCANPQYFLQNHSSFNRVKGAIQGNILIIECEDPNSTDTIYWSVIAERKDPYIKQWDKTNSNGYLVTEYDASEN